MPVIARTRGANCPYCSGHRAGYGNDLASLHPGITSEWHPTRNGTLTPDQVVPGSAKAVWWKASCGHEWRTLVFVRTRGSGCPACWRARSSRQQTDLELALLTTVPGLSLRHRSIRAGERWWQCDLVWPGRRLVVEFDGSYWYRNTAGRDRRKAEALRRAGWTVVRVRESPLRALHPYDVVVPPVHIEGVLSTASRIVDHLRDCLLPSIPSSLDVVAATTLLADEGEAHYAWRNSTATGTARTRHGDRRRGRRGPAHGTPPDAPPGANTIRRLARPAPAHRNAGGPGAARHRGHERCRR